MRKNRFRIILTLAFLFLSIWFLKPTYDDYKFNKELKELKTLEDSIAFENKYGNDVLKAKEKRLKLGLDLQGGMYVIMEVDIPKLLENLAKKTDDTFKQSLIEASEEAQVKPGQKFSFIEEKEGWYKINYEGVKEGWIYGQYAEKATE